MAIEVEVKPASVRRTGWPSCIAQECLTSKSLVNLTTESLDTGKEVQHFDSRCHQAFGSNQPALDGLRQKLLGQRPLRPQAFLAGLFFFPLFALILAFLRRSCSSKRSQFNPPSQHRSAPIDRFFGLPARVSRAA